MDKIIPTLVGLLVLLLGRKLYWLFVGSAGFALGAELGTRFLIGQPVWMTVVVGLVAGIVGALASLFLQRLAVTVAGFVAAGYATATLVRLLGVDAQWALWLAFLLSGILGGVLVAAFFDWALVLLSSLIGATLVIQAMDLGPLPAALAFAALAILGVAVQVRAMWATKKRSHKHEN